jgi:hypothetical protein
VQITRITPLRLMILQFSQSFLTDARTFIFSILLGSTVLPGATPGLYNSPGRHIERRQFQLHPIPDRQTRHVRPRVARRMSQHSMAVSQFGAEQSVPQLLYDPAFSVNGTFARHVSISGSPRLTRTVCSKWADS